MKFLSRAGQKLEHAIAQFNLQVTGFICADLGCNVGGFTDVLLRRGASKVYAIDTGYGVLDWKLRNDPRVVVMERTNALHVELSQQVQLVTIDVAWTRQRFILPAARKLLSPEGRVITLIKPHYEAAKSQLKKGVLANEFLDGVVSQTRQEIVAAGFEILDITTSPITGAGGNVELLALLRVALTTPASARALPASP